MQHTVAKTLIQMLGISCFYVFVITSFSLLLLSVCLDAGIKNAQLDETHRGAAMVLSWQDRHCQAKLLTVACRFLMFFSNVTLVYFILPCILIFQFLY